MKKIFYIMIAVLTLGIFPTTYLAAEENQIATDEKLLVEGETEASVFYLANDMEIKSLNRGITFALADKMQLNGESDYVFGLASTMTTKAMSINNDAFLLGENIDLSGIISRDAYILGGKIDFNGKINRNAYICGNKVVINGEIGGQLNITADEVVIGENAIIDGVITMNEDVKLTNNNTEITNINYYKTNKGEESKLGLVGAFFISLINLLVIGFALLYVIPKFFSKIRTKSKNYKFKNYLGLLGKGYAAVILVPFIAIALMISTLGSSLGIITVVLYVIALYLSIIVGSYIIGLIISKLTKLNDKNDYLYLSIGILCYKVLTLIPYLGAVVSIIIVGIGFGLIIEKMILKR